MLQVKQTLKSESHTLIKYININVNTCPFVSNITVPRGAGYLRRSGRGPSHVFSVQPLDNAPQREAERTMRSHSAGKKKTTIRFINNEVLVMIPGIHAFGL